MNRRTLLATAVLALAVGVHPAGQNPPLPTRIVSLVPPVTEMIFAMDAGRRVVGVGTFDRHPPEVAKLPRVGGLLNPNTERILALNPDLVVVYEAQQELKQALARANVPFYSYAHKDLANVTATMRALGVRLGTADAAERLTVDIERRLQAVATRVRGRPRPGLLLVFGRDAKSLAGIYANGGYGFLHDIVELAGGRDVFEDVKRENVQASTELILARRPDVIIELHPPSDAPADLSPWNTLSSLPAVRNGRVHQLVGDEFLDAGPRVAIAAEQISRLLHPEAWGKAR
jgi:iron complex transport system substrate-binding protein